MNNPRDSDPSPDPSPEDLVRALEALRASSDEELQRHLDRLVEDVDSTGGAGRRITREVTDNLGATDNLVHAFARPATLALKVHIPQPTVAVTDTAAAGAPDAPMDLDLALRLLGYWFAAMCAGFAGLTQYDQATRWGAFAVFVQQLREMLRRPPGSKP